MDIIYLEGAAAEAADRVIDDNLKALREFKKRTGAKSMEAVVTVEPPMSDVDAD